MAIKARLERICEKNKMINTKVEREDILDKLIKFNKNMRDSKKNVGQRMFFVEDARQQRTQETVTEDKLSALFREG